MTVEEIDIEIDDNFNRNVKKCLAYFLFTRAFSKTAFLSVHKKLNCSETLLSGAEREQRDSRSAHYSH